MVECGLPKPETRVRFPSPAPPLTARSKRLLVQAMTNIFTPAHLHLALNHIPIIGLAVACLPVLIGILFHSRSALASGLLAVLFCTATVPSIMETGEAARESFVDGSAQPPLDEAGNTAFHQHAGRARATAPVVYACGILALMALLALLRYPRQAAWIGWSVLAGCVLSITLGIWTAEAGGRIRHAEFRASSPEPPPQPLHASPLVPSSYQSPVQETSPAPTNS